MKGWIGVDLDGTLAYYDKWRGYDYIGEPIPKMIKVLQRLLDKGYTIKIFTARAVNPDSKPIIQKWLKNNGLPELDVTNIKDFNMKLLIDDRCLQVKINTGNFVGKLEI